MDFFYLFISVPCFPLCVAQTVIQCYRILKNRFFSILLLYDEKTKTRWFSMEVAKQGVPIHRIQLQWFLHSFFILPFPPLQGVYNSESFTLEEFSLSPALVSVLWALNNNETPRLRKLYGFIFSNLLISFPANFLLPTASIFCTKMLI